jgi:hypothetical protein
VPLDPASLQGATSLHLRFSDIAFDAYRTLADITLDVSVTGVV